MRPRRLPSQARPARRRHRSSRGAVAVEAALVTPIFILLVFGTIEFGMLFKDWLAMSSSVRAGARLASAEPRMSTFATDAASNVAREATALDMSGFKALWVYRAAADGTPIGGNGSFSNCTQCWKFSWNASTRQFDVASSSWPSTSQNACQGDPGQDSIGVYLKIDHPSVTGLIFDSIPLEERAVMRLEPIPTTRGCKP